MKRSDGIEAKKLMNKMDKKYERQEEFFRALRIIFFTPLSIVFKVISFVSRIAGVIASFVLFYGIYRGVVLYNEIDFMVKADIISEIILIAKIIVFPFIAFLINYISTKLQEYFYIYSC